MNETDWTQRADELRRALLNAKPTITITTVMQIFGYSSRASAEYALQRMQEIGAVKLENGRWYLTS